MASRLLSYLKTLASTHVSSWRMTRWLLPDDAASVQASLLRLLSIAQTQKLELAPLIHCFAAEHRGLTRFRLWKFAKRLASGTPLLDALEQTPGVLSDEDTLSIRFGMQSGTLHVVLSSMVERSAVRQRDPNLHIKHTLVYHACLAVVAVVLISGIVAFILPTFTKMRSEMDIAPLQAQVSLERVCSTVGPFIPFILLLVIAFGLVVRFIHPFRSVHHAISSHWFHSIAQLRVAHLLRLLSIANDAGRPLAGSMSTLARYHFDRNVRAKLLFARNEIELAAEPWSSLASAQLLNDQEATALAASHSAQTRSWLMRRLADSKEEQVMQRFSVWLSLVHPALVVAFGLLVLWIAWACFGTLCQFTRSLS